MRETLLGAAAITTFHDSIAEEIAAALPAVASRLAVVPQSVSLPPASAGGSGAVVHGDPCLLFPAGIRPVKRPLLPLASLDGLLHQLPGLRLWYAGPSLDLEETKRLEWALSSRPWARYLGPIPHGAMPSVLEAADIVLNCSLSEGGMANAVLEAFAFGRAVLASDIPGNRSLVENGVTGLLFRSETDLAGGVEKLATDPALRRRLGDAGRRLVESRFTPARETEGYLEVYARVAPAGRWHERRARRRPALLLWRLHVQDRRGRAAAQGRLAALLRHLGVRSGERMLEIGAGTGLAAVLRAARGGNGGGRRHGDRWPASSRSRRLRR